MPQYTWQGFAEPPFNATRFAGVTKTASKCCDLCKLYVYAGWPRCNAWSWCADKKGCLPPMYGSGGPTDKHGQVRVYWVFLVCSYAPPFLPVERTSSDRQLPTGKYGQVRAHVCFFVEAPGPATFLPVNFSMIDRSQMI